MTLTVVITGLDLTPIIWRAESLWLPTIQSVHHIIPGAEKGPVYIQGRDNRTATIEGRCPKNTVNENLLDSMIGRTATILGRSSHTAVIMDIQDSRQDNPAWIYFVVSLIEC